MSIDIKWETVTGGPDGEALAESIRSFIHEKFQQVALPRFIRSVQVHSFDFGSVSPDLEIKDICDPLPDFYEDDGDDEEESDEAGDGVREGSEDRQLMTLETQAQLPHVANQGGRDFTDRTTRNQPQLHMTMPSMRTPLGLSDHLNSPFLRSGTPGIPGGTSNMSYFHLPLGQLSGTQTPLAAVAGGTPFSTNGWHPPTTFPPTRDLRDLSSDLSYSNPYIHSSDAASSPSRPSTANTLPPARSPMYEDEQAGFSNPEDHLPPDQESRPMLQRRPSDLQVVCQVKYAGDVKLSLTAEILLDYPMPSFVGIPLKLNITGLTFDGVAVIAYIRHKAHFCFLTPEDAETLVGAGSTAIDPLDEGSGGPPSVFAAAGGEAKKLGGLLQEIKVESEIGRKENGKQVLKNVGKVEKFVLEQVRRIFEDEFVYPSFWTFLV